MVFMRPMKKTCALLAIAAGLAAVHGWSSDSILDSRLMYVPFETKSDKYKEQGFRILDQKGMEKGRGTALSDKACEFSEWPLYGKAESETHQINASARWFQTGGDGQAVAFPAEGNWMDGCGSLVFWVKGAGWDVAAPQAEELITLEGEKGRVVFGKTAPKTLSLAAPGAASVSIPIDFDPDRLHLVALTYADGKVSIYIDGQPKAEDVPFAIPEKIKKIIVGQTTSGGKPNKFIDDLSTYDRPLLLSEINRLYVTQGLLEGRDLITVIKTRKPVKIDGIIEPDEWSDAAEITGLLQISGASIYDFSGPSNIASDQSMFWVTYDDQNLYVAHYSPPPAKIAGQDNLVVAMLQNTRLKHDADVDADDCVRVSLLDPYPNGVEYKMLVNGAGTTYDFYSTGIAPDLKLSGTNLSWNPDIRRQSTLTNKGWFFEMAVPWSDFYFGKPLDGRTIRMNFCRLWRQTIQEDHVWCFGNRTAADNTRMSLPAGEVVFAGDKAVVVQLQDVGQIRRGQVDFKANIVNRMGTPQTVTVTVATNSGELKHEEKVELAVDETKPYEFKGKICDFRTHGIIFAVANAADGKVWFRSELPVLRKDRPELRVRKYRSIEKIKLQTNMEFLGQHPLGDIGIALAVRSRADGKAAFENKYRNLANYNPEFEISTEDWPVGTYEAEISFNVKDMKPWIEKVVYERVPLPEWWDNDIGKEEGTPYVGVPYPWNVYPLKVQDDGIYCWARLYQFGKRLLPEQITTWVTPQSSKMLRAPMRLTLKSADGETLDSATADAESKWTKQSSIRVEGVRSIAGKDFSVRNDLWAEYDGLVWCRLTIQPKTKITLDSMELEIPLANEFTDVINTYDYSQRQTGKLPKEGFVCENRPIWLGNGDAGIQWFCETDGWFFQKDNKKMMNVELHPEGVTMRVVMIDVPTEFDKPHVIEFGFIATPVRPRKYRTWQDPQQWGFRGGPGGWYPQGQEFMPAPDWTPGLKAGWTGGLEQSNEWSPIIPVYLNNIYVTTGAINTKTKDFEDFGDEWLVSDNTAPSDIVMTTHASKSYRDWFVWRHWRAFQNIPHQSLYYDGAIENPSSNLYAGAGYVRRDGSVATTYPILGARDICKRLYNMIIKYYPFVWVGFHQSGMPNMAYEGFGTWSWDGENFNSIINDKQPTYLGVLTPAKFRAEYMGHNMGWPVMFLGQGRIRKEWADAAGCENVIDHLHGLCLLHDVPAVGWQIEGEREKVCERTYRAVERHRLSSPAYRFVPYWRQDIVQLPRPEIHASFYILQEPWKIEKGRDWAFYAEKQDTPVPKKAVMIVYNDSDFKGEMHLNPDWKKMGFDSTDGLLVENAVHSTGFRIEKARNDKGEEVDKAVFFPRPDETARIENGGIAFPMTPFNYRMIVLEKR